MKTIDRTVSDIIDTEYLEYSMYVLEQRAIPSAIDGLKKVHRKLVYSMLNVHNGKKTKLSDMAGISSLNYHHGESSAASAAVTLTADWNNNCPVFTGHGNFGSRLIQDAAAPRYIYCSLSPEFKKIFIDEEIAPPAPDLEDPEPAHYLPIIPWVLVNGIAGIAVGFATDILPRSVPDLIEATRACVKNPTKYLAQNDPISPTFPQFRGAINSVEPDGIHWSTTGIISYVGKYTYKISELPIGYDRESYVILLNKMVDSDKIKDYDDDCSDQGFGFTIKTTGAQKELIDQDPISYFKLRKLHSENLTTLGSDGKLKIFSSVPEIVHYFVQYRTSMFGKKIQYDKDKLTSELVVLRDKIKFIEHVISNKINFKTMTKSDLLAYIGLNITAMDHGKSFINIPLYECTVDAVQSILVRIADKEKELTKLESTTPEILFLEKLKSVKI